MDDSTGIEAEDGGHRLGEWGGYPRARKTFGEYTERTAFERPLTSGVAYALKVLHSERDQFEKQQGWTIKKMETKDQTLVQDFLTENLDPAPIKDEYAPVIFSQETVGHIVSINMMSGKEARHYFSYKLKHSLFNSGNTYNIWWKQRISTCGKLVTLDGALFERSEVYFCSY
ncbi:hypothetical protein F3Y22_tig00116971pilonHSYRG01014 [Hibiscus syriacus]|uniref:CHASE domain-containing protein n=1 Tax=Hibiscus syriacus TaxID=106335 RepID=A0A6A2XQH2_HIBSY|nr:hypothetical protein F3Y22_tig00116971pilonHSYRG01014 [Hibiscus syriacus]